jgi:hypothetical protein
MVRAVIQELLGAGMAGAVGAEKGKRTALVKVPIFGALVWLVSYFGLLPAVGTL